MTNLEWMKENGYDLNYTDVIHDEDLGRITFVCYPTAEMNDPPDVDLMHYVPLLGFSYNTDHCPDYRWKWYMSVGFAKWLQEEHKDGLPEERWITVKE